MLLLEVVVDFIFVVLIFGVLIFAVLIFLFTEQTLQAEMPIGKKTHFQTPNSTSFTTFPVKWKKKHTVSKWSLKIYWTGKGPHWACPVQAAHLQVWPECLPRDGDGAAGVAEDAAADPTVVPSHEHTEPHAAVGALLTSLVRHPVFLEVNVSVLWQMKK